LTRYLLKLSGEALGGDAGIGIEPQVLKHYCDEIEAAVREGIQLAVVLGGGNLFRGAHLAQAGMDRVVGDRMGMLATIMNGLALNDFLRRRGIASRLFSAVAMAGMVDGYRRDAAQAAMDSGEVVILPTRRRVYARSSWVLMLFSRLRMLMEFILRIRKRTRQPSVFNISPISRYSSKSSL
jgi:uridylate kinase